MTVLRWFLILGAFCALVSCGNKPRRATEKKLREVGAPGLRREAASLYKELFVAPNGKYFIPKVEQWPPTFRRFDPLRVGAYPDGFSLAIDDTRTGEEGLYVVPAGMDGIPREGRNAHFHKIDEGVYWYSFTD